MGQIVGVHFAGSEAAAESGKTKSTRLFADEANDFKWRAHTDFVFADGANRFEGADDADRPIIFAAVDDRIEMRPCQDRWCSPIAAFEATEDVADGVDSDCQTGLAHQMDQNLAASEFFNRKYQPRDGAMIANSDAPNGVQISHQAAVVHQGGGR